MSSKAILQKARSDITSWNTQPPATNADFVFMEQKSNGEAWERDQVQCMQQQLAEVPDERFNAQLVTIFRLPAWYHETNKHLYEPKMVAIGPYHRGKESLQAMEDHKWCSLHNFLAKNKNVHLGVYFRAVRALESQARHCYSECVRMESRDFVTMLLLDACFIIDYFEGLENPKKNAFFHVGWAKIHLYSDLFLLENQIPFSVIHKLITIRDNNNSCNYKIPCPLLELCHRPLRQIFSTSKLIQPEITCSNIHHLLHLYYKSMVPDENHSKNNEVGQSDSCCFDLFSFQKLDKHDRGSNISCVSELHEAGITFKKKRKPLNMFDISFKNGIMEIPLLKLEDTHKVILWNMAAFEQSQLHSFKSQTLSSYLALMDLLINTEKDVTILERGGVIENYLQSNEDVAEFFNQFAKSFVLNYDDHYYLQLFQDVKKYSNSTWHRNRARLKHDYFRNPWTTISVLAAAVLLILTSAQTYFSANPKSGN